MVITAHLTHPIPRPSANCPGIPEALDQVIARGMAKRPEERFERRRAGTAATDALTRRDQDQAASILQRSAAATVPGPTALRSPPRATTLHRAPRRSAWGYRRHLPAARHPSLRVARPTARRIPHPTTARPTPAGWAPPPGPPGGGSKKPLIVLLSAAAVFVVALGALGIWSGRQARRLRDRPGGHPHQPPRCRPPSRVSPPGAPGPRPPRRRDRELRRAADGAVVRRPRRLELRADQSASGHGAWRRWTAGQRPAPVARRPPRYSLFADQAALDACTSTRRSRRTTSFCGARARTSSRRSTWHYKAEAPTRSPGRSLRHLQGQRRHRCGPSNDEPAVGRRAGHRPRTSCTTGG